MYIYIYCQSRKGCPGEIYYNIFIYRSRGYCNICGNTKILSCVFIARSISVEIKTCLQYILYTMPRPYIFGAFALENGLSKTVLSKEV